MGRANAVRMVILLALAGSIWFLPQMAVAHCDTLDGPVVADARKALDKGDVTPVLKWVRQDDEKEIRELFTKTLVVRKKGKEARELADLYFFETLVRIHRAGEGAPYTGLKHEAAEPIILAVDKALDTGSAAHVVRHVSGTVASGIQERYDRTREALKHAQESVEAGRKYVEAYVELTHYVERLFHDASHSAHGGGKESSSLKQPAAHGH
ncbi:MAG: hypothetical protein A2X56_10270 [Nitrospirae bacterium GWC2_57_13]|nr:MAG: hypothetical protein A2X56_10270 [Nitrospirae bacterium GWC2_57_13]OGW41163.1 MAG: hypothetical protein A2X57_04725 [Nitrospirae bacterium GWD2_57_8]